MNNYLPTRRGSDNSPAQTIATGHALGLSFDLASSLLFWYPFLTIVQAENSSLIGAGFQFEKQTTCGYPRRLGPCRFMIEYRIFCSVQIGIVKRAQTLLSACCECLLRRARTSRQALTVLVVCPYRFSGFDIERKLRFNEAVKRARLGSHT